jgi:hypothetical protein
MYYVAIARDIYVTVNANRKFETAFLGDLSG